VNGRNYLFVGTELVKEAPAAHSAPVDRLAVVDRVALDRVVLDRVARGRQDPLAPVDLVDPMDPIIAVGQEDSSRHF